jgi:hypothetical protein
VRPEGLSQRKIPMTPSIIERATFWLVAQYLNRVPPVSGEADSRFGAQISSCGQLCVLQGAGQPATRPVPEKLKCGSVWVSMVYHTPPT